MVVVFLASTYLTAHTSSSSPIDSGTPYPSCPGLPIPHAVLHEAEDDGPQAWCMLEPREGHGARVPDVVGVEVPAGPGWGVGTVARWQRVGASGTWTPLLSEARHSPMRKTENAF